MKCQECAGSGWVVHKRNTAGAWSYQNMMKQNCEKCDGKGEIMTPEEYTELAAKTDAPIDNDAQLRACDLLSLDHVADGLVTKAGEFKDVLKKHKFYGKPVDYINLVEEMGDMLWYIAKGCRELGVTMEEVMEININKLKKRYGEKFSEESANDRNLSEERKTLELGSNESVWFITEED